ncbi:MAG: hypothetical protein ACERJ2_16670 [Filomicrobium sp.]
MSDSLSWIDDADTKRIRGILTRSVDVIAAARQDLEEHRCCVDNRLSTELLKRELSSQPANQQRMTSAQRRAFFRQLLRTPNPDIVTTPSREGGRNYLRVDNTSAEHVKEGLGAKGSTEIPKGQSVRLERQPLRARFQHEDNEELKQDGRINRRRKRQNKETAPPRSVPNYFSSKMTSAQRRAFFRQLLRTPNPDIVTTPSREGGRNYLRVDNTSAEHVKEGLGAKGSTEIPKGQSVRLERQPLRARFQHEDNEELKQDGRINRRRKRQNKETAPPRSVPNYFSSMLVSWTQRLDYLTNVVIGVLATALAILLFVRAGPSDPYPDALPLVANAKKSGNQQAILFESGASLHPAQGFNILPKAFPEPLPTFAEDISGLLFLAAPLPASAPGITVLPYTGLPQALPVFPEDIAQLIMIASSPGPDGRDYLIRTLVFEASGETEIGKVAVAHVILNRKGIVRANRLEAPNEDP